MTLFLIYEEKKLFSLYENEKLFLVVAHNGFYINDNDLRYFIHHCLRGKFSLKNYVDWL